MSVSVLSPIMHSDSPLLHAGLIARCVLSDPGPQFDKLSMLMEWRHVSDGCTCLSVCV